MGRKFQAAKESASGQTKGDSKTRSHSSSSQGDSSELKKAIRRTVFTPQQLYYLEERFMENQFPDADQREEIATHLNLTSQHIQVWFQNKRAKARRKLKKMEIEKPKVHVPKPPPFWPQHLPFDSNFTEKQQNPGAPNGEIARQVSSSSTKVSQSNPKSHTSTTPATTGTSGTPMISPASAHSINEYSFNSYSMGTGANPHKGYPLNAHSALCSNGAESSFYSPCGYDEVRNMSSSNQPSKPTMVPRESASFQQSTDSTHYHPTTPTSGLNGRKADNDSLLLLANCATLATAPDSGVQSQCPSLLDITEVSSVALDSVYNPNCCYQHLSNREECQQYNQPTTSELYPFSRHASGMRLSSASESEAQKLNYPIQTPMFSEGVYPLQDVLSHLEPEWHSTNPS